MAITVQGPKAIYVGDKDAAFLASTTDRDTTSMRFTFTGAATGTFTRQRNDFAMTVNILDNDTNHVDVAGQGYNADDHPNGDPYAGRFVVLTHLPTDNPGGDPPTAGGGPAGGGGGNGGDGGTTGGYPAPEPQPVPPVPDPPPAPWPLPEPEPVPDPPPSWTPPPPPAPEPPPPSWPTPGGDTGSGGDDPGS